MKNYMFESPTRLYFGNNEEDNVGKYIKEYGFKKILLVYGKSSAKRSGLYDRVIKSLKDNKIEFLELSEVSANPTLKKVNEGLAMIKNQNVDLVLAMGGGSVIDTAKSIANGYYYDGNTFDFNEHKLVPIKGLPVGVILTIPAAGSEFSMSCVITDEERNMKRGYNSPTNRPLFAIESNNLINGLPFEQYAYGITDILAHSIERYFSPSSEIEFADYLALGLMKSVVDATDVLLKDFNNDEAKKVIILASSISHSGHTSLCKDIAMPVHQMEHEVSGLYPNIAHGLGLAVLFPYWMEKTYTYMPKKFAKFGEVLFNIKGEDDLSSSKLTIEAFKLFLKKLGLNKSLKDLGVAYEDLEIMAQPFVARLIPGVKPLDYSLAREILIHAWKGE